MSKNDLRKLTDDFCIKQQLVLQDTKINLMNIDCMISDHFDKYAEEPKNYTNIIVKVIRFLSKFKDEAGEN